MEDEAERETFLRERPHLLAVTFRILNSDADAQDVAQKAWTRYARADTAGVRNVPAWLTTVVTRLCLDLLRRSREEPWEPDHLPDLPGDTSDTPEEAALRANELTKVFGLGVAAAIGLVAFFVGAVIAHVRARVLLPQHRLPGRLPGAVHRLADTRDRFSEPPRASRNRGTGRAVPSGAAGMGPGNGRKRHGC